ncbi:MAG: hypothetical protein GXP08_03605 [Gammaproteobacteria bacterium]|nr:hypothetical protein [Gammaproteobacteria bacterium]
MSYTATHFLFAIVVWLATLSAVASEPKINQNIPPSVDTEWFSAEEEIEFEEHELAQSRDSAIFEENALKHRVAEYKRGRMAFLFGQYKTAYAIWQPLANQGYAKAQATMGWIYQTGKGVNKDPKKAFEWYSKAAAQQHIIAQNNLGVLYEQGLGARKSISKAATWYRHSAEWGYSFAQYNLGVLYKEGRGVKRNLEEAQFWLQIAALQGVDEALIALDEINQNVHQKSTVIPLSKRPPHSKRSQPRYSESVPKEKISQAHASTEYQTISERIRTKDWLDGPKLDDWLADAQVAQQRLREKKATPNRTNSHSLKIFNDDWVRQQNPQFYTLQLARSDKLQWLLDIAKSQPMLLDTAYYSAYIGDKQWFYLIYGNFENRKTALAEAEKLPKNLKKWSPWARPFSAVHSSMIVKPLPN